MSRVDSYGRLCWRPSREPPRTADTMNYEARVIQSHGYTRHYVANDEDTEDVTDRVCRVKIVEQQPGMYYLLRFDSSGDCIADTVHFSFEEARAEAEREYVLVVDSADHGSESPTDDPN